MEGRGLGSFAEEYFTGSSGGGEEEEEQVREVVAVGIGGGAWGFL